MNSWFLSWLLSENTLLSQNRQTKYEPRAVSSKVGLFQEDQHPTEQDARADAVYAEAWHMLKLPEQL